MLHLATTRAAICRLHGAGSAANLQEAMPPTRTHFFKCVPLAVFFACTKRSRCSTHSGVMTMKQVIASLRSGNWKALLACFLFFDTGFTAWVMFGPLAPYVSKQLSLSPTQAGFLVAVPVLSASIVRVTLGNLFQSVDGRRLALLGISISAIPSLILLFPITPTYPMLLMLGTLLGVGGASFAIALPMAGSSYPPRVQGLVLGLAAAGNVGAVVDGFLFPGLAQSFGWQRATMAVIPLLAVTAVAVFFWAEDRSPKSGSAGRAFAGLGISIAGLIAL